MKASITAKVSCSAEPQYLWGESFKSFVWMLEIRLGQELKSLHQVIAEDHDASALPFMGDVLLALGYRMRKYWIPAVGGYVVGVELANHPIPTWAGKFPGKPGTVPIILPRNDGTATEWPGSNIRYSRVLLNDEWDNGVDHGNAHISIDQIDICLSGEIHIGSPSLEIEVAAGRVSTEQARRIARALDDAANLLTQMQTSEKRE